MLNPDKRLEHIVLHDLALGDDALALAAIFALFSFNKDPLTLVATYGNRATSTVYRNQHSFIKKLRKKSRNKSENNPVFNPKMLFGADKPLDATRLYTIPSGGIEYVIHGNLGNDNRALSEPEKRRFSKNYYQSFNPDTPISILSIGATTELTIALENLPNLSNVKSIVMMAGTLGIQGNVASHVEANSRHDTHATQIILETQRKAKIPTLLVPLDATEDKRVLFTKKRMKYLEEELTNSPFALGLIQSVAGENGKYGNFYLNRTKRSTIHPYKETGYSGVPIHDLTAALMWLDFMKEKLLFDYADVPIEFNQQNGAMGVGRPNFDNVFDLTVAGPPKDADKLWALKAEIFRSYQ